MAAVLYSDKLVEITDEGIRFHVYYFPLGSKSVAWKDIERVITQPAFVGTGSWRLWGTSSPRYWFPLDWSRPKRDRVFLLVQKSKRMRIGFTVVDSGRVSELLRARGLLDESEMT